MKRRSFLKNIFLFTGGLVSYSAFSKSFSRLGFAKNTGATIKGKVLSGGKPLANVVVTDSYSVVATGADGTYEITPHQDAVFITISTPSGYAFTHEDYIIRQYKPIAEMEKNKSYDFELTPLATPDEKHQFIIWADPQVKNQSDVHLLMSESVPDMQKFLKGIPAGTLMHGICVGDIVWDTPELHADYGRAVKRCKLPFFQAKGNHDMDYNLGGNETADITFKKNYGPTHYSFNRGNVHYVVLDDVFYLGKDREYKGHITEQQLNWLQKDLSFVAKDKLLIVCTHIPVHDDVDNREDLYALLQPFSKCHIMSGHTHYNRNVIRNGIYEHNHGTVCGAWWTGPICQDGTPNGYAVYEVDGTDLKWYYKTTGEEKNHQISLFKQKSETGEHQWVANVYNWDPAWKVECWINGGYKGELKNKTGLDPLAVETLLGPTLPAKRSFAEPTKTDHLFFYPLNKEDKHIKIVATDRFGNKYEATA